MVFPKHKLRSRKKKVNYSPKALFQKKNKKLGTPGTLRKKNPVRVVSPPPPRVACDDSSVVGHRRPPADIPCRSPVSEDDNSVVLKQKTQATATTLNKRKELLRPELVVGGITYFENLDERDVLTGRGNGPCDHVGNGAFRGLIEKGMGEYFGTHSRKAKDKIARKIVSRVKARKGLFVRKLSPSEVSKVSKSLRRNGRAAGSKNKFLPGYVLVDDETAIRKTKQAFRYTNKTWDGDANTRLGTDPFETDEEEEMEVTVELKEAEPVLVPDEEVEEHPTTPSPTIEADPATPPTPVRPTLPVFQRDTSIAGPPLNVVANLLPRFSDDSSSGTDATTFCSFSSEEDPEFAQREQSAILTLSAMIVGRRSSSSSLSAMDRASIFTESTWSEGENDGDDQSWTSTSSM